MARTEAQKSTKVVVLIPEPVEPGLAPITMRMSKTKRVACAIEFKSVIMNPALRIEIEMKSASAQDCMVLKFAKEACRSILQIQNAPSNVRNEDAVSTSLVWREKLKIGQVLCRSQQ